MPVQMSKRARKGQGQEGDEDQSQSGTVADTVAVMTQPQAQAPVTETDPEAETETGASKSEPEPKRRSARLSLKPAPAPAPAAKAPVARSKRTEQKVQQGLQGQAKSKRGRQTQGKPESQSPATPAPTPAAPVAGYTSDGTSFEDVTDADDDMLPDIIMESPSKERKYLKDDIVWAPYKDLYWPAIVTSVKLPSVCYLYINDSGEHVFKKHVRYLLPFDNPSKNLELKELGEKAGPKFKEAYDLVKKYLMKRKLNQNLNARRFLTLNQNDKVAQAKTCLLRLTGSFDGFDDDEEVKFEELSDSVLASEDEDDVTEESNIHTDGRSPNEKAKIEAILKDLETLPANMTVSAEQHIEMEKEANELLSIIRSKECYNHLMQIREGSASSSRHMKYMKQEDVIGGLGPFTLFQDLTNELLTVLDNHCDDFDTPDYKQAVMLPEAIIYAITKIKDCSKLDAKRHFHRTCKKVGVQD